MNAFPGLKLEWRVEAQLPFVYGISKNATHRPRKGGGSYLTATAQGWRICAKAAIKSQLLIKYITPRVDKVWLHIVVSLPNHRGDAVNVVDQVCDAVKLALGVDDRWFAISCLDWRIDKKDPGIFIAIGQEYEAETGRKKAAITPALKRTTSSNMEREGVGRVA